MLHLNIILTLHALSALLFAFLLILVPGPFAAWLGAATPVSTDVEDFCRLAGLYMVGVAILTWFTRTTPSRYARRLVVGAMFGLQVVGVLVGFLIVMPNGKLFAIVFYGLFAVLYLYIILLRPQDMDGPYPSP